MVASLVSDQGMKRITRRVGCIADRVIVAVHERLTHVVQRSGKRAQGPNRTGLAVFEMLHNGADRLGRDVIIAIIVMLALEIVFVVLAMTWQPDCNHEGVGPGLKHCHYSARYSRSCCVRNWVIAMRAPMPSGTPQRIQTRCNDAAIA